jgi:simple sugar transport system ATP-binding protein
MSPSVAIAQATVEKIGEWMSGLWDEDVQPHLAVLEGVRVEEGGVQHAQA